MKDSLDNLGFYVKSLELWDKCWDDCELLGKDFRGIEVAKQLIRAVGSISANIEEGYGRGYGKEYPQFLRISRGSAREAKGWYVKSKFILSKKEIDERVSVIDQIIAMETKSIQTLELKREANSSMKN